MKKAMVVCGGWVMVRSPAGADVGMLTVVEFPVLLLEAGDAVVDI